MDIIKRDGTAVPFNKTKIKQAIEKAMKATGLYYPDIARIIAKEAETHFKNGNETATIFKVEDFIFERLCHYGQNLTAKAYESYKTIRAFQRQTADTDEAILSLIEKTNEELMRENSNKKPTLASTQRDMIAGETSKSIVRRKKLPANIVQAHDDGIIHFHDMDYAAQGIFNCMLINMKDMLNNGTVINGVRVDTPTTFQTACTVATQIMASIASGQYGGQTTSIAHLAPFVRKSFLKLLKIIEQEGIDNGIIYSQEQIENIAKSRLQKEIKDGVQTIQYQINTLSTSNGQSPFASIYMYINEEPEYEKETAMIIEEILRQRIVGVKNEQGIYVTPAFPKLLYVLDEDNTYEGSKYFYLTKIAAECSAKRLVPDYISAKVMKENVGHVFPCMGCRSFLSPWYDEQGQPKFYGRFNMGVVSINLVDVALSANGNIDEFWNILETRLKICKEALLFRINRLKGTTTEISPIHWEHGGVARLPKGSKIDDLLENGYATASLGYVGLYECVQAMIGESHTTKKGEELAIDILEELRAKCEIWKKETGYGFGLYGTPAESLVYKFARTTKNRFGVIPNVTDRLYFTNSYHVHVTEEIDAFSKMAFEAQFQKISSGGCISYVETPNMTNNIPAVIQIIQYIYENIQYCEINTKSDGCIKCGFQGELEINDSLDWTCPNCGNQDLGTLYAARRTCGYVGSDWWNKGKTEEIKERVVHLD